MTPWATSPGCWPTWRAGRATTPSCRPHCAERARQAEARAIDCILATQVRVNGRLTVWSQQHDPLTLAPVGARNYEPASLASAESADMLVYLMSIESPSPQVVAAIEAGAAWFKASALRDKAWQRSPEGSALVDKPGAPPLWARYYSLDKEQPIFGDRDLSIHDDVSEISVERRNGYSWFNTGSQRALDEYTKWKARAASPEPWRAAAASPAIHLGPWMRRPMKHLLTTALGPPTGGHGVARSSGHGSRTRRRVSSS